MRFSTALSLLSIASLSSVKGDDTTATTSVRNLRSVTKTKKKTTGFVVNENKLKIHNNPKGNRGLVGSDGVSKVLAISSDLWTEERPRGGLTFDEHEVEAQNCGGFLASIHSDEDVTEMKDLWELFYNSEFSGGERHGYVGLFWDVATDAWTWTDGTDYDYEHWQDNLKPSTQAYVDNRLDPSYPKENYVAYAGCEKSNCKLWPIHKIDWYSKEKPGIYLLPENYADKNVYPNCDTSVLFSNGEL